MGDELPDVPALRVLAPPPGGLATLRARLAEPRRRRWWWLALPALAAAVALVLALRPRPPVHVPAAPRAALPDRTIGTTFYWVASTPGAPLPATARISVVSVIDIADAPRVHTHPGPAQ